MLGSIIRLSNRNSAELWCEYPCTVVDPIQLTVTTLNAALRDTKRIDHEAMCNTKTPKTKRFLGIPYDWRLPTIALIKERSWNPGDRRILTPKVFGWGYSINFYEVGRRLGLLRNR
jgi:hypothetical protein